MSYCSFYVIFLFFGRLVACGVPTPGNQIQAAVAAAKMPDPSTCCAEWGIEPARDAANPIAQ